MVVVQVQVIVRVVARRCLRDGVAFAVFLISSQLDVSLTKTAREKKLAGQVTQQSY